MSKFQELYKSLNPQQKEAVDTIEGPVMVIAGPGSGKTQTLSLRIANILDKTDAKPSNILALTFTDSAAANMTKRLVDLIGVDGYKVRIQTFHAFCNEVIQSFPEKFSFSRELTQINDLRKLKIMNSIFDELDLKYLVSFGSRYFFQNEVIRLISEIKKEGITPNEFAELIKEEEEILKGIEKINSRTKKPFAKWTQQDKLIRKNQELGLIYREYESRLREEGLYDYEDMILFVVEKFEKDDELLAHYQEQFLYILVDEFQDTNGSQSKILELLGSFDKQPNIFVVGDDDQSIFRFQGANVENMYDFVKAYPNTKVVTLDTSYRTPEPILKGALSLVEKNQNRLVNKIEGVVKDLESTNKLSSKVEIVSYPDTEIEDLSVAARIEELIKDDTNPSEIAILYKKHQESENLQQILLKKQIPFRLEKDLNIFEEEIAIKFLNLVRIIQKPENSPLLFEVLNYDFLGFERLTLFKLGHKASKHSTSLVELIVDDPSDDPEQLRVKEFVEQTIGYKKLAYNTHLVRLLEAVLEDLQILEFLKEKKDFKSLQILTTLFTLAKNLSEFNFKYKLTDFLRDVELMLNNQMRVDMPFNTLEEGVNFLTVHKAKGLEFEHVFIIHSTENIWSGKPISKIKLPSGMMDTKKSQETSPEADKEEDRRLFFVALTRAKKAVTVTYSKRFIDKTRIKELLPSQFLYEIDPNYKNESEGENLSTKEEQLSLILNPTPKPDFNKEEREFLTGLISTFRLSFTALEDYLESPEAFLFRHLIRVPSPKSSSQILGTIIHKALEIYNRNIIKNDTKEWAFYASLLDFALKREYISEHEAKDIMDECLKVFQPYFSTLAAKPLFEIQNVEYGFYGHKVYFEQMELSGKIDKIEWYNKERKEVRIVDYKTSTPKSRNQILGKTATSDGKIARQLAFYKILTELDENFPYKVVEFEVNFIKPSTSGKYKLETFTSDEIDTEEVQEKMREVIKKIRNLEFSDPDV